MFNNVFTLFEAQREVNVLAHESSKLTRNFMVKIQVGSDNNGNKFWEIDDGGSKPRREIEYNQHMVVTRTSAMNTALRRNTYLT
jgi:hypothetical protein